MGDRGGEGVGLGGAATEKGDGVLLAAVGNDGAAAGKGAGGGW